MRTKEPCALPKRQEEKREESPPSAFDCPLFLSPFFPPSVLARLSSRGEVGDKKGPPWLRIMLVLWRRRSSSALSGMVLLARSLAILGLLYGNVGCNQAERGWQLPGGGDLSRTRLPPGIRMETGLDTDLYARIFRPYHGFGRQLYIHGFQKKPSSGDEDRLNNGRERVENLFRLLLRSTGPSEKQKPVDKRGGGFEDLDPEEDWRRHGGGRREGEDLGMQR